MTNGRVRWLSSTDAPDAFPAVELALTEPDGLLAAGGDLSVERLLCAYQRGIFPWYEDGQPLLWWSPDPRCLFLPGDFRLSRRMRQIVKRSSAEIRINSEFAAVTQACAAPRRSEQGTWITAEMMQAYESLHRRGWAHSIEVWDEEELVGGLYGVAIGRAFFGESMFSRHRNASKMALLYLGHLLQVGAFDFVDCQVQSSHLDTLGARVVARPEFMKFVKNACNPPRPFENWPDAPITVARLSQIPP